MTFSIACGDVMPGCPARFEGATEEDVLTQVAAHARDDHGITEITPDVLAAVEGAITED